MTDRAPATARASGAELGPDSECLPAVARTVNAFIPVRVTHAPRTGSVMVYLPNGTAVVVNSRFVLPLEEGSKCSLGSAGV